MAAGGKPFFQPTRAQDLGSILTYLRRYTGCAVLGVAAVVCVSAAVAGEMLQDLKAGYILGGTPWRMQVSTSCNSRRSGW